MGLSHGGTPGLGPPQRTDAGSSEKSPSGSVVHLLKVECGPGFRRIYQEVPRDVLLVAFKKHHVNTSDEGDAQRFSIGVLFTGHS